MYNDLMSQIVSVTEFKAHCLEFINQVSKTGKPITLTKRGKPTAMVVPPPKEEKRRLVLGQFRDQVKIVGDILEPFDEPWEALS
jgi:prevent-host-death family protein